METEQKKIKRYAKEVLIYAEKHPVKWRELSTQIEKELMEEKE